MSIVPAIALRRPAPAWWWAPAAVGVAALLARPWFLPAGVAVEWRVAFFLALGAAGVVVAHDRALAVFPDREA
ncbi:MAG: hypothetical protein M3163_11615, partial [Actinomycetota bacterium]|nr:hypothetical protein [Actinomycetota bacterium]